jgi:hypothetical protein
MPWESAATPSGPNLSGADGRRIPCWGERPFTVTIGGIPRQWRFLLAAVSFPILGVDFLRHHALAVDVANLRLFSPPPVVGPGAADQGLTGVKAPSGSSVPPASARSPPMVGAVTPGRSYADAVRSPPGVSPPARADVPTSAGGSSSPSPSAAAPCGWLAGQTGAPPSAASFPAGSGDWLAALQRQFPQVFFQDAASSAAPPPHGVQHIIQTTGQPATAKFGG